MIRDLTAYGGKLIATLGLAKTPRKRPSVENTMSAESEADQAFEDGFLGISQERLRAMRDSELIQYQIGNKPGTVQFELAAEERHRRMISHQLEEQFKLDAKLAAGNERAMIVAAVIGVLGALAGAALGMYATFKTTGAQTSPQATQSHTQPRIAPSKVPTTTSPASGIVTSK